MIRRGACVALVSIHYIPTQSEGPVKYMRRVDNSIPRMSSPDLCTKTFEEYGVCFDQPGGLYPQLPHYFDRPVTIPREELRFCKVIERRIVGRVVRYDVR